MQIIHGRISRSDTHHRQLRRRPNPEEKRIANKRIQHYKMGRADAAHFEADARRWEVDNDEETPVTSVERAALLLGRLRVAGADRNALRANRPVAHQCADGSSASYHEMGCLPRPVGQGWHENRE